MRKVFVFLPIAAMLVMTMPIAWAIIIPSISINDHPEGNSVVASSEISSAREDYGNEYYSLTGDIPAESFTWGVALPEPHGEGWTNQAISNFMTLTGSYGGFGEKAISLTFGPDDASGHTDASQGAR